MKKTNKKYANKGINVWTVLAGLLAVFVVTVILNLPPWQGTLNYVEAEEDSGVMVELDYDTQDITLTLYEVPVMDDNIVVEPDYLGDYPVEADKVYAVYWDATPLYRNREAKINVDINVYSDYLIKEDGTGTLSVAITDHRKRIIYSGEISLVSASGNVGIEFAADKCRRRAYGSRPEIEDSRFYACFYTSGQLVEHESGDISGTDGKQHYEYGAIGSESDEKLVTQPKKTTSAAKPKSSSGSSPASNPEPIDLPDLPKAPEK